MRFKANYILIPLIVIIVSVLGSIITSANMDWYQALNMPEFTPSGIIIGIAWTIIFILSAVSVLIVWNKYQRQTEFKFIMFLFAVNAVLNITWSGLFFGMHEIGLALMEIIILESTVVVLILLIWLFSKTASLLLAPYALWVGFATYLTYSIWMIN